MPSDAVKTHETLEELAALPVCPNCGGEVVRKSKRGAAPKYCSSKCQKEMAARDLNRGKALIRAASGWYSAPRGSEVYREAFREMNAILQMFKEEDAKAARPRADIACAKAFADGTRYMDRRKI